MESFDGVSLFCCCREVSEHAPAVGLSAGGRGQEGGGTLLVHHPPRPAMDRSCRPATNTGADTADGRLLQKAIQWYHKAPTTLYTAHTIAQINTHKSCIIYHYSFVSLPPSLSPLSPSPSPDEGLSFPSSYPTGCLLGCVDMVDCLPQEDYREQVCGSGVCLHAVDTCVPTGI